MEKTSEYRRHAAECRQLMKMATSEEQKDILEKMYRTWDSLAADRERLIEQAKRIALVETAGDGSTANRSP